MNKLKLVSSIKGFISGAKNFYSKYKEWSLKQKIAFLTITPLSLLVVVELVERHGQDKVTDAIQILGTLLATSSGAL